MRDGSRTGIDNPKSCSEMDWVVVLPVTGQSHEKQKLSTRSDSPALGRSG